MSLEKTLRIDVHGDPHAPGGLGAAASIRRRKPCRSARRGALASRRKRLLPRNIASGASAGPSTTISPDCRRAVFAARQLCGARQFARIDFGRLAIGARDDDRRQPPERRQAGVAARSRLLGGRNARNRLTASRAGRDGPSARSAARRGPAFRRGRRGPATWVRSWNVRSAARGSPSARPISASTTPTSVSCGKLWPLATICVPISRSNSCSRPPAIPRACARARRACRTTGRAAARRETARRPPRRRARRRDRRPERIGRAALRAEVGPALDIAAMMADQRAAVAMLDQPGRAIRALKPWPQARHRVSGA